MTATDIVMNPLGGVRVLVAEGEEDDAVALTAVLRLHGFDAREARTEEVVIRMVLETAPAVLILDLDLPGHDKYNVIRRVRALPDPPTIVVVTGHTAPTTRAAALKAGAAAYLLKPADPLELVQLVTRLGAAR
jgi:DNA-binding response OmpR family regulator